MNFCTLVNIILKIRKLSQPQHKLNSTELGLILYMDSDYNSLYSHIMYTYAHNLEIVDIVLQCFAHTYVFLPHNYNFMCTVTHNHENMKIVTNITLTQLS